MTKKLQREYAQCRADYEAAERAGNTAEADRLAREYRRLTGVFVAIGKARAARQEGKAS